MATPGDVTYRALQVVDVNGNPVTGLSLSGFTVYAYSRGYGASIFTAYSAGSVMQEVGSGTYDLSFLLPAAAGWFYYRIVPNGSGQRILSANCWQGEVESVDLAAINANVVVPVATITTSAILGMPLALQCIAYRYRTLAAVVKTQSGATVDLTQYNDFAISIRSKDQQTTKWDAQPGCPYGVLITGDSSGNLSLTLPESSSGPLYSEWSASLVRQVGDFLVPTVSNGWIYRCTTAGTSAGTQPTWNTTLNSTTTDGTAVWTAVCQPIWRASTAVLQGAYGRPKSGSAAVLAQYWIATTAGTTESSEPAWPASPAAGATVTDGTVVWTYQSDWFAALESSGDQGVNSTSLYYELTGNLLATDETVPVIQSSQLLLSRREVGT